MNYLMLVLDGLVLNRDFLSDYFYREFKKAEKEDIGWKEFLSNLEKVVKDLRYETERPYFEELSRWNKYVIQQADRGIEVDMPMPEKHDTGIPLLFLSNQKYTGHLWGSHVDYIEKSISEGCERLLREKGLFPLYFYEIPKNIMPSEAAIVDPTKLQKIIELSQRINNLSFIAEIKSKEPENIKEYLDFHLRCYLRNNGRLEEWIKHTQEIIPDSITSLQKDVIMSWFEDKLPEQKSRTVSTKRPPVKSYALMHVYWSKYDKTKRITDTNKMRFSEEYGYSPNTLKREFDKYLEPNERKPVSENMRAVEPYIKALCYTIELLKPLCAAGFEDAEKELESIKFRYLPK